MNPISSSVGLLGVEEAVVDAARRLVEGHLDGRRLVRDVEERDAGGVRVAAGVPVVRQCREVALDLDVQVVLAVAGRDPAGQRGRGIAHVDGRDLRAVRGVRPVALDDRLVGAGVERFADEFVIPLRFGRGTGARDREATERRAGRLQELPSVECHGLDPCRVRGHQ